MSDYDLCRDPLAAIYEKQETVTVEFATEAGELMSKVGPNRYAAGDALVSGVDGDRWSVSRERFERAYLPLPPTVAGASGRYRNIPRPVWARQMGEAFRCQRTAGGDWLCGEAGDWLLQYAPGDFGLASDARFRQVYRRVAQPG